MSQIAPQRPLDERQQLSESEQTTLWALLDELTDPEIPVITLREMGILRALRRGADGRVEVVITPTYSGCPAMEQIHDDIAAALARAGVAARVVTQLAPAWTTDWMTAEAREKLRAYGIAPPHSAAAAALAAEGQSVVRFAANMRAGRAGGTSAGGGFGTEPPVACPQCGSTNTTETSHFGSTACKALYRCLDCMEPFDHFKRI